MIRRSKGATREQFAQSGPGLFENMTLNPAKNHSQPE
jgi:hypothetical protein